MNEFNTLSFRLVSASFRRESLAFWMICGYLFVEYVRPQSIIPELDFLPWAQLFIILSLIAGLFDKSVRWVSDSTNKWMVLFAILTVLSIANATYPDLSRKHVIDFFGWFVIYFLIITIVNSERRFFIFLLIFLLASFKISASLAFRWAKRGFSFTSWGLSGPPGYFQNSGELAIQMIVFAAIAYYLMVCLKPTLSTVKRWVVMAMPLTAAMTVLGASSRGAQLAMLFQLGHAMLAQGIGMRKIILVASLAAIGYWAVPEEQKQRFLGAGEDKTSTQRLLYWERGIDMIKEHPWEGVGYFNFPEYFKNRYPEDMLYDYPQLPHNIFIQIGTDSGIPGLLVYVMLIYSSFRKTREVRRVSLRVEEKHSIPAALATGFDGALLGFLIAGQFVTVGYYPFFWINLAFVVSLRNVVVGRPSDPRK